MVFFKEKLETLEKVHDKLLNKESSAKLVIFRGDKLENEPAFIPIDIDKDFISASNIFKWI